MHHAHNLLTNSCTTHLIQILTQSWVQAANVANQRQRHRIHDVIAVVSRKLQEIDRFQAAAELHESVDDIKGEWVVLCSISV